MQESTLNKIRRVLNLGEQKITNKEKAEWHDAEADHLQGKSAASVAKWYGPNVKPAHAQEAHRRNIAIHREKAERHRKLFAELGESADAKRDPNGLLIQYHHASAVAMDHWNRGDNFRAVASQRRAEKHAEAYHKLTGKRVVDPLYVGNSPHIGSVAESYIGEAKKKTDDEELEPKSASVFPKAHHWNNAKRVYGVPLGVKLQDIGGFGVDKDGNRVSRKELVQRHAFAAANSASKFTPEQKRAWVQAKIAKAVAAKKAREANK
jgi:hypothetical protein